MYFKKQRKVRRSVPSIVALITTTLLILPFQATAEGSATLKAGIPIGYKEYHVHYDVNADGTYTESDELAVTVLTDQGVLQSKNWPVGIRNSGLGMSRNRDVEVLTAYTLKKNGEHIDAIQPNAKDGSDGETLSVIPIVAFQQVEIGDTLVFSYKAIQKEPIIANHIALKQFFPKFIAYEDAIISLTAPASLHLRIETVGVGKAENIHTGNIQKMVWKYQNKEPEAISDPRLQLPSDSTPRIHISTFKDDAAEMDALNMQTPAKPFSPPFPKNKGCKALGEIPNDGPDAIEAVKAKVGVYFWHNEIWLEGIANEWSNPECVFDDGRPMLGALKDGYGKVFKNQPDWSESLSRLEYLKKKFPDAAFVALAEAVYWSDYAWNARGDGFASSVTPDGWKLFSERLEKAEKVLNDTKSYSSQMPGWYDEMILVQSALDRPADDRDKTFLEGAKKYKTYYPTYFTMLNFLSPKWGGTWETVDNLVKWSVDNTKEIDGNSMYARLYWSAAGGLPAGTSLFKDTRASWPKMKQGFEDLMARHPRSRWNLNNFAKFACMANDKSTFLALRSQIGKDVIDAAWPRNTSLDLCETKFGYSQ
jgi:Domain of Unknown Function with PDB structure (DUF3857)